ncbi:MAG: zinc-binding dehydrogenase, partial [Deltaproteobacteria bacterium]|jgi:L-iditol 2-dehydrogenase|nr:zinc-binding dehydrogenase [Deltaproteobacteria bacterium]
MVDFFTSRLLKAKELGAKDINFPDPEDLNQDLTNFSQNKNFDIAIDAAGTAQAIKNALYSLKKGGILVLAKYTPNSELTVPINVAIYKELTLKTVFRYHDAFPAVIETVREGIVRPREVVTDIFNFNDIQEGMTRSLKEKSKILKAIVKI